MIIANNAARLTITLKGQSQILRIGGRAAEADDRFEVHIYLSSPDPAVKLYPHIPEARARVALHQ